MTAASADLLATYPHLSDPFKEIIASARNIRLLGQTLNSVYTIDDRYILRRKNIVLQPYDDIGSCANFAAALSHLKKNGFDVCPRNARLETTATSTGQEEDLLLYEFSKGKELSRIIPRNSAEELSYAKQIGQFLARLHTIKAPQYGFFHGQQFSSWYGFISHWLEHQAVYIKRFGILDAEIIDRIGRIFSSFQPLFEKVTPVTIHMDLSAANILVNGQHIDCVIDWDNARGGDAAYDVSYALKRAFRSSPEEFKEVMLNTYLAESPAQDRKTFMQKYELYSLFMAYKLLPVHYTHASLTGESTENLVAEIKDALLKKKW